MRWNEQGRGRSRGENGALKMMDGAQCGARELERSMCERGKAAEGLDDQVETAAYGST